MPIPYSVKLLKEFAGTGSKSFSLPRVTLESRGMEPRLSINHSYLAGDSSGLLPSVAQPPFPLHEFLPLQLFMPLHECVSAAFFLPISSETPAFVWEVVPCAVMAAPLIRPAIAAPAISAFDVMLTFLFLC